MSNITLPFQQPGQHDVTPELEAPRAAVIEIVERHQDTKKPYSGTESIICPNTLRINGAAVWATQEDPARVEQITLGERDVVTVTVRLPARALRTGDTPSFVPGAEDIDAVNGAVIEIPDVDTVTVGDDLDRPYVLVNGRRIYTAGPIVVEAMATHGSDQHALIVTLPLICRKLTIDDEPLAPPVQ